jgi:LysM repeat protein
MSTQITRVATVSQATYRRRRVVAALFLATSVAVGGSLFSGFSAQATSESATATFDYVTVTAGTTLWGLAQQHAGDQDPREWIAELVTLNALSDEALQPGQRLALPAN